MESPGGIHWYTTEGQPVTDLSVVLISRNQEWNIARLIESVLEGTCSVLSKEIVLVDSASTDKTMVIARNYPISILRLRPDQRLTPPAGRYAGYGFTSGELVLFLDGDMELCNEWLENASAVMETMPNVAVVTGPLIDLPMTTRTSNAEDCKGSTHEYRTEEVLQPGGAAMYRRSVLEQVGTFNPWFYSEEEPELSLRIRHAGFQILRIEQPIAYHYSSSIHSISTLVRRWRRNLYLGMGQGMRWHVGTDLFWPYVRERGFGCIPGMALLVGLFSFAFSFMRDQWIWLGSWALLMATIIVVFGYRKRNLYQAICSLVKRLLIIDGTLRGFLLKPRRPSDYPTKVDLIKRTIGNWENEQTS